MRTSLSCILLAAVLAAGCAGRSAGTPKAEEREKAPEIRIVRPEKAVYRAGERIVVGYASDLEPDSVRLLPEDERAVVLPDSGGWTIVTDGRSKVGTLSYRLLFYAGGKEYVRTGSYTLRPAAAPARYRAVAEETIPHEKNYFLQGMEIVGGRMYLSSGGYARSFLDAVDFPSMRVRGSRTLDRNFFAEGLTVMDGKVYQLTWKEKKGFVYDLETLEKIAEFEYPYEGWGLTNDGKFLYLSDGSQYIYRIDPETFREAGRIEATCDQGSVGLLNELEWIDGEIWANVFTADYIVRIDPETGRIAGVVFCGDLTGRVRPQSEEDVLNGIARDPRDGSLYLSGKNWKKIFRVRVVPE